MWEFVFEGLFGSYETPKSSDVMAWKDLDLSGWVEAALGLTSVLCLGWTWILMCQHHWLSAMFVAFLALLLMRLSTQVAENWLSFWLIEKYVLFGTAMFVCILGALIGQLCNGGIDDLVSGLITVLDAVILAITFHRMHQMTKNSTDIGQFRWGFILGLALVFIAGAAPGIVHPPTLP